MSWYRRGKLSFDVFRSLASRPAPKNQILKSGYLNSCPKGATFNGFSSFSSISKRLVTRDRGVNRNVHNPFVVGSKRFYYVDPRNVQHFRPRGPKGWFQNPRHAFIVVVVGSGVLITVYFGNLETIPYTKRRHLILLSKAMERRLGESQFEQMKAGFKGKILPPIHPESVRVRMIAQDIVDALQRGLRKDMVWSDMGYASENAMVDENAMADDGRETLYALSALSEGKVKGNWSREDEILDDRWVGHAVARHSAEGITKNLWFAILQLVLYQFVTPDIVNTMSALFLRLPFSRRYDSSIASLFNQLISYPVDCNGSRYPE
ncbi:hypothetical protein RIF29_40002 [Crotalaria pallida]|uniref:Uncharacterized protein n=1 Tax=Crotalaria pallida TaxID=3830 RepID=A0AAN9E8L5_CROPI